MIAPVSARHLERRERRTAVALAPDDVGERGLLGRVERARAEPGDDRQHDEHGQVGREPGHDRRQPADEQARRG